MPWRSENTDQYCSLERKTKYGEMCKKYVQVNLFIRSRAATLQNCDHEVVLGDGSGYHTSTCSMHG